jgi:hypothetical protein
MALARNVWQGGNREPTVYIYPYRVPAHSISPNQLPSERVTTIMDALQVRLASRAIRCGL